jgi:hypothetical protein
MPPSDSAPQDRHSPGSTSKHHRSIHSTTRCPKGCPWRGHCPVHRPTIVPRGYDALERMMRLRHETPWRALTPLQKAQLRALREQHAREVA